MRMHLVHAVQLAVIVHTDVIQLLRQLTEGLIEFNVVNWIYCGRERIKERERERASIGL